MATRVPQHAAYDYPFLYIEAYSTPPGDRFVKVTVSDHGRNSIAVEGYDRDEFLDGIQDELNVIIIEKDDLPKVRQTSPQSLTAGTGVGMVGATVRPTDSPADMRATAAAYLALAEHLEQNPPVDEAAVYALGLVCIAEGVADPHRTARRLVAAGVRAPQAGDDQ